MRSELRAAIERTLSENDLDGLVYPTIGQLPVRLGDPQTGDPATGANCTLSANSGLPAISFPAGFTDDGLPVGIEILGSMLSDAELLAIADSYEKANPIRRPPAVTPAIVQGVLPQVLSRVIEFNEGNVQFEGIMKIDRLKNEMRYSLAVAPDSKAIYAVNLVRAPAQGAGQVQPAMVNLLPPQRTDVSGEFLFDGAFQGSAQRRRTGAANICRGFRSFRERAATAQLIRSRQTARQALLSAINQGPNLGFE